MSLQKNNKMKPILSRDAKIAFSNNEEKKDLGIYFDKFGWPKRESNAAIRILQKV